MWREWGGIEVDVQRAGFVLVRVRAHRIHMYLREFPAQGDSRISGMIKAVHGLAAGFAANGAKVTVLCEGHVTSHVHVAAGYDVRCYAYDGERGSSQSLPSGLRDYLVEQGDALGVVVLNSVFNPSVYLVSRTLRRMGVPYIVRAARPVPPLDLRNPPHWKWPYGTCARSPAAAARACRCGPAPRGVAPLLGIRRPSSSPQRLRARRRCWRKNRLCGVRAAR